MPPVTTTRGFSHAACNAHANRREQREDPSTPLRFSADMVRATRDDGAQFPFKIFAAASAKTWQPNTMSASAVFSVK
jgi:hypothetical protein